MLQWTLVISTSSGPNKNVEISECRHNSRQWYADEFSLCLTLYTCAYV